MYFKNVFLVFGVHALHAEATERVFSQRTEFT